MRLLRRLSVALVTGATTLILSSCAADSTGSAEGTIRPADDTDSLWQPVAMPSEVGPEMPELPTRVVRFETTEGTWMGVDVSPDGQTIVFDLLGDLYQLPIEGGDAVPLTSGTDWDQVPRFSPDGTHIYFVSDRAGYDNIWRLTLADQSLQQVTHAETNVAGEPNWSRDGKRLLVGIAAKNETGAEVILHAVDPTDGTTTPINPPSEPLLTEDETTLLRDRWKVYSGQEASDGKVYFSETQNDISWTPADGDWPGLKARMFVYDRQLQTRAMITEMNALYQDHKPQLSHDERLLAYFRQYSEHRTELRVLNRKTGQDALLVELADVDYPAVSGRREDSRPIYAFTPDDQSIVFWHAGQIRRVQLADGSMDVIPFRADVEHEVTSRLLPAAKRFSDDVKATAIRWPSLSLDGKTMVFSAFGYAWVMDMVTGNTRRLTDSDDFEYMPAISPDGSSVAYISIASTGDDYGRGHLVVTDIDNRDDREILADSEADFFSPKWSPDGSKIALIRQTNRYRPSTGVYGWTNARADGFREVFSPSKFADRFAVFMFSRSLSFDAKGERLLIGYPRSTKEAVLVSADLSGSDAHTLAVSTPEVFGIAPAPDLKNLALTRMDGSIWIVPFGADGEPTTVSSQDPTARKASLHGGYYVDWNNYAQFTFGLGTDVFRYRMDDDGLRSTGVKVIQARRLAEQPVAFVGARLVTLSGNVGVGRIIESGAVVVDGARVSAIGPTGEVVIPSNAKVVDVTGKTLIPGLIDTHYHAPGSSSSYGIPASEINDANAVQYGITSAWIPAGQASDGVPAIVDLQNLGRLSGPRWTHSAQGPVGMTYDFHGLLTSYDVAREAATQYYVQGADVLKEYNMSSRQQRQWLAAAAYELGMGIVSHLESFDGMMTRIVDGYTGGDHLALPETFYTDVLELLRQTGYVWTTNIVLANGVVGKFEDMGRFFCDAVVAKRTQGELDTHQSRAACDADSGNPTVPYNAHRASRVARSIVSASRAGITLGMSGHNAPGSRLHEEMWHHWKGGMSIEDVLRATTMVNAEKLGVQEEVGSLEVGKIADFVILDENPLDDMLNTLSIQYTIQGGVIYDADTAGRIAPEELQRQMAAAKGTNHADDAALEQPTIH